MTKKLFAVYLGGKHDNCFIEDHDLVFVVAQDNNEAKKIAKQKTRIKEDVHCDGIIEINTVDGFSLKLIETEETESIIYDNHYQKI